MFMLLSQLSHGHRYCRHTSINATLFNDCFVNVATNINDPLPTPTREITDLKDIKYDCSSYNIRPTNIHSSKHRQQRLF